jgi:hypothetical protein
LTPLNAVQTHILALLGFPSTLYQGIGGNLVNWPCEWANREVKLFSSQDYHESVLGQVSVV